MKRYQKITFIVWLLLIATTIGLFFFRPDLLDPDKMSSYLRNNNSEVMAYYIAICVLRCVTLIPATPFILLGIVLFPDNPDFVMVVCLSTVMLAALIHYKLSRYLGFDAYLERKFKKQMNSLERGMQKRGILYIFLWTIAPFMPSDLAYYMAGVSRMHFGKFFFTVFVGASFILAIYIYLGQGLFEWVSGL